MLPSCNQSVWCTYWNQCSSPLSSIAANNDNPRSLGCTRIRLCALATSREKASHDSYEHLNTNWARSCNVGSSIRSGMPSSPNHATVSVTPLGLCHRPGSHSANPGRLLRTPTVSHAVLVPDLVFLVCLLESRHQMPGYRIRCL